MVKQVSVEIHLRIGGLLSSLISKEEVCYQKFPAKWWFSVISILQSGGHLTKTWEIDFANWYKL
jgi:hypothetical protein